MSIELMLAFATSDTQTVDQHFGMSCGFSLYHLNPKGYELRERILFEALPDMAESAHSTLNEKLTLLTGCAAVYATAIGHSAAIRCLECGIQPLKVDEGSLIVTLLTDLHRQLTHPPLPAWLNRLQRPSSPTSEGMENRIESLFDKVWNQE
jgi:nitrogen fixation protein NifX